MAESLVGKIAGNAGKQWSRNTVADGNWLNSNTVQKFNENDKTLAEAIESVSAALEHFTPEITPSAWPCAANKTIQNIEQNADGSLNVTYQPIESSTTSDESLWSWYQQNAYDSVLAVYTETHNDINHKDGELSTSLTIPEGIYDVKVEVLYEPTQSTINNKLDIAISKSTNIDDALYQTFILFDDSLIKDTTSNPQKIDVQSQWITGIIDLAESTTLKFLIKGESAQGRYKLNNIYINSIGGAAGPEGPQGPAGPTGPTGPTGPQGIGLSAKSSESDYGHYIEIWKQGASQYDTRFEVSNGQNGISLSAKSSTIDNVHTVEIWQEGASTAQTSFNVLDGADGDNGRTPEFQIDLSNAHWQWKYTDEQNWKDTNVVASGTQGPKGDDGDKGDQGDKGDTGNAGADGITPSGFYAPKTEGGVDGTEVSFKYSSTGTDPRDFSFFVPNGQSTGATQILGGNGIEAVKAQGEEKYTVSFSGGNFQNLSAYSAERARAYFDPTQNTEVNFYDAFNNYLPLSGGRVKGVIELSGSTFDEAKLHFVRQNVSNTVDVGIGSNGEAVLKSAVPNNGYAQLMLSKNTGTNYPDIKIKIDDNGANHKVMSVPESEYNNMAVSGNQNLVSGPNYTLAKTANGFTIGAALVNCTDINSVTLAPNTYYFVYEV